MSNHFKTLHWSMPTASHFAESRMDLISSELVNAFQKSVSGNLDENGYLVNCELPNVNPRILRLPEEILEMRITSSRKVKDDSGVKSFFEAIESIEKLTPEDAAKWLDLILEKGYYDDRKGLNPAWFALNARCESHWLGIKVAIQFGETVTLHLGENNYVNVTGLERRDGGDRLTPSEYFFVTSSGNASFSLPYVLGKVEHTPFIW